MPKVSTPLSRKNQLHANAHDSIPPELLIIASWNAADFVFEIGGGVEQARQKLVEAGAQANLATDAWVRNHYRWIIWKLASQLRRFPHQYAEYWSFDSVVQQLRYRYEVEINLARRSALKAIIERDDIPSRHLVLCISHVYPDNSIELTDGWYGIRGILDDRLRFLLQRKQLSVGQKLHIQGATMGGTTHACPALEVTESTYFKLSANGVQPASWHERLGYSRIPVVKRSIKSLVQNGGAVACIDVIVARTYPIVYFERLPSGLNVSRTEKEEIAAETAWQNAFMAACQQAAHELQAETSGKLGGE
eukprot:jgi/Hompol1/4681/HPOL_001797-RA